MQSAITLEALAVLDAIDRRGSFAAAADSLNRVPSAISYTVQKLEQDLAVTLFVREGRKAVLTPAGRLLLEQGRQLLQAADDLAEATRQRHSGWESSLNIAVEAALGVDHVYPLLAEFFAIKPDIEINLFEEVLGGGWEALQDKRADLAIGLPPSAVADDRLQSCVYGDLPWVFAVAGGHPLALLGRPLTTRDIEPYRAVVARDSARHSPSASYRLFSRQPVLRVPSVRDKLAAQKAGLGVGFLPLYWIQPELASGELVALAVEGVENNTPLLMAWRRGQQGRALRWFIETLRQRPLQPPATTS
ncbi:MAG TPA: LysR family transcriptional regulator [Pseudomonadales bacterium]